MGIRLEKLNLSYGWLAVLADFYLGHPGLGMCGYSWQEGWVWG
jgi:hypothetical protein